MIFIFVFHFITLHIISDKGMYIILYGNDVVHRTVTIDIFRSPAPSSMISIWTLHLLAILQAQTPQRS